MKVILNGKQQTIFPHKSKLNGARRDRRTEGEALEITKTKQAEQPHCSNKDFKSWRKKHPEETRINSHVPQPSSLDVAALQNGSGQKVDLFFLLRVKA